MVVSVALATTMSAKEKFSKRAFNSLPEMVESTLGLREKAYDFDEEPSYEVLLDESWYEVGEDGVLDSRSLYVIRFLSKEGISQAYAATSYMEESDKVLSFDAWLIDPEERGAIRRKKTDALDRSNTRGYSLASSHRYLMHDLTDAAKVGHIFAYETISESRSLLGSKSWYFQSSEPVRLSRIHLKVPEGWTYKHWFFGGSEPTASKESGWQTWERRDLVPFSQQDFAPSVGRFRESMAFTLFPPDSSELAERFISVRSWGHMSRLFHDMYLERMVLSDEARDAAREKVAEAGTRFEKAKALAEMAQSINYTNVSLDLGFGGGYIPRYSKEVHENGWGDCKDKSTYLCALLESVGLQGFPIIVNGSPRHWIDSDVPFPGQFNHCIAAIKADDSFPESSTVDVEGVGRLLIFDPTDPYTAVGDLSSRMQGTGAVLIAGEGGGFITLPKIEGANSLESCTVKAEIMPNGSIVGFVNSTASGQSAIKYRIADIRNDSTSELEEEIKERMDDSLGVLKTGGFSYSDDPESGVFEYSLQFGAASYAKPLDARNMLVSPVLMGRQPVVLLDDPGEERVQPIMLSAKNERTSFEVYLPVGFQPVEMPEPVSVETSFGRYSLEISFEKDQAIVQREFVVKGDPVDASEADEVERFFRVVSEADATVLSIRRES